MVQGRSVNQPLTRRQTFSSRIDQGVTSRNPDGTSNRAGSIGSDDSRATVFDDDEVCSSRVLSGSRTRMREVVSWCREVCGGNGIGTDYVVARFFADAEALYTYEGTAQMNSLIVGRAISGQSAFA